MLETLLIRSNTNRQSVLSYAVSELGVNHVIVMGHYGCGGVAASIASAPVGAVDAANGAVQSWIEPIREIFQTSNRYARRKFNLNQSRTFFFTIALDQKSWNCEQRTRVLLLSKNPTSKNVSATLLNPVLKQ